ncbi:hypothetical protein [Neomoorella thermoacetica]|uniref:hypothetical protein n=1 Tax=Neomoorella thermoacetica TaxID=1525 RepID=UPI001C5B7B59|nr:hypothetical protein [Moorella thermoacetica]
MFFAGAELALTARPEAAGRQEFYVTLVTAGFAMWNMGVAFIVGLLLHEALARGWIKV